MGGEGGAGHPPAGVTAGLRAAYEAAAGGWADGPERVYAPLARALVLAAPVPVAGRRVLDLGAGTGVAGRAALAAGAGRVVSADLAVAMLSLTGPAQHPVAADATALPFRDRAFDLVVAAFCLNHLDHPGDALGEIRARRPRPGRERIRPRLDPPGQAGRGRGAPPVRLPASRVVRGDEAGGRAGRGGSGPARRPGGRRGIHRRAGRHHHRADRRGHPRTAGVMAAGPGPHRPVPALAGPGAPGRRTARRRACGSRDGAADRPHAGPHGLLEPLPGC